MDYSDSLGLATILKDLEETVTNASRVPLSSKVLVDGEAVLECVDKIYAALPEELKEAKKVLENSDKLLESVEGQSKRIISEARQQADQLTQETQIYQEATRRAEAIIAQSEQAAIQLRHESIMYCDDVLRQLEENIQRMLLSVTKNREDLKKFKYYSLDDAE